MRRAQALVALGGFVHSMMMAVDGSKKTSKEFRVSRTCFLSMVYVSELVNHHQNMARR